jgi:multiple sugar transport system substrate-binding protein
MHRFKSSLAVVTASMLALVAVGSTPAFAADAACEPSDGDVTLSYWSWMPGVEGAVDEFNATHPGINVELSKVVSTEVYGNLSNALRANDAPDMSMIEFSALPSFLLQDGLTDVSNCAPIEGIEDRIEPWTYELVTVGTDGIYATPSDSEPMAMYYRKDIFEQYGIPVPTTWEEYAEAGRTLQEKAPGVHLSSLSAGDTARLYGLMWQNGARPFTYEGDSVVFDMTGPEAAEVANFWQGLLDEGLLDTSAPLFSPGMFESWSDGTVATAMGAVWLITVMTPSAPDGSGKWAVAPLPQWTSGEEASGNWGGASTAIMRGTEHPYEAAVFANWLSTSDEAAPWVYGSGGLRTTVGASSDPEIDAPYEYYGGQQVLQVFQDASEHVKKDFQWAPNQVNVDNFFGDGLAKVIGGSGTTILDALAEAQDKAVSDLQSQGIDAKVK